MYLVRTLHCNPLPLVNATKKKKCWPWETQRLDFEGVFLEAWVCNWVERQGGWLWWCSRKHKGECVCVREHTDKKKKKTQTYTNKETHTHTCKRNPRHRLTSMHSAKHIHDRQQDQWRQSPGGLVHYEVSGQPLAPHHPDGSEWARASSKKPSSTPVQSAPRHQLWWGFNSTNEPPTPGHH